MKLVASIILSFHLLTTLAQGSQSFKVPGVSEINGDLIRNRINSKIGMDFSQLGHPQIIPVGPAPSNGNSIGGGVSGTSVGTETKDSSGSSNGDIDDGIVHALEVGGGSGDSGKSPTDIELNDF